MLDNVTRFLRPGGVFIGTIPNAEFLLYVMLYLEINSILIMNHQRTIEQYTS
jgi:hypothetical protein